MYKMRYIAPSTGWMEGLPIGNGRLAAMVWGDATSDVLTLNHEWLWCGVHRDRKPPQSAEHLAQVRDLLKKRDFFRATELANVWFAGDGGVSPAPGRVDAYQPAGALTFTPSARMDFLGRELDLETGIASVHRAMADAAVRSSFCADCETGLLRCEWRGEARFGGALTLSRVADPGARIAIASRRAQLTLDGAFDGGLCYRVIVEVDTDGNIGESASGLIITEATRIRAAVNIATTARELDAELARYAAAQRDFGRFDASHRRHCEKFAAMMHRAELTLEEDASLSSLPLEERLARMKAGADDNGLLALYFNYGRYLLLSSTILGDLPANLQGKWNDRIDPPWDCDYHFDINLQMNHWMAEPLGMTECAEALLRYAESYYDSGREAARALYGCGGIVLPIQSDAWGVSTPESFGWAVWIGAAAWIARHFWEHYVYSGDHEFLCTRAWRFFSEVARFYEDYLVEGEDGTLEILPSQSPENRFVGTGVLPVSIGVSSAMDVQLAYDALGYAAQAARLLGYDAEAQKWQSMRDRLPLFRIGDDGRLLEWNEEKTEAEPGHRHLSHLYGVYPSDLFTERTRAPQFEAARKSLDFRLARGGGHTGWSRAWVACLCTRFGDPQRFYEHFTALIREFTTVTLLDLHPPEIFQIDGNLGAVAAVIEAAVSFTDGRVHLLRCLPAQWANGSLRGIRVPGGHRVSVRWENRQAVEVSVMIGYQGSVVICGLPGGDSRVTGKIGETVRVI